MRVLILGGYGVFGGRLAELLSDIAELEIFVCGRNLAKASFFCSQYQGQARVIPVAMDRSVLVDNMGDIQPEIVIDASGPFQKGIIYLTERVFPRQPHIVPGRTGLAPRLQPPRAASFRPHGKHRRRYFPPVSGQT